jgi:transcriptional regulator with XRE-family HTH domain
MLVLKFARHEKRWSQKTLADAARLHQHYISLIERGRGRPMPDEHARLARALDVPEDKLLQQVDLTEVLAVGGDRG